MPSLAFEVRQVPRADIEAWAIASDFDCYVDVDRAFLSRLYEGGIECLHVRTLWSGLMYPLISPCAIWRGLASLSSVMGVPL